MNKNNKIQAEKQEDLGLKGENTNLFSDLLEFSRKVRISDKIYDVSPLSYKLIEQAVYHYLFLEDKIEFYKKIILSLNKIYRFDDSFLGFNLLGRFPLFEIYFSYVCNKEIFNGRNNSIFDFCNHRSEWILPSKWTDGELDFLSFHDFLIYDICSGYIKNKNKKVFVVTSGNAKELMIISPPKKKSKENKALPAGQIKSRVFNASNFGNFDKFFLEHIEDISDRTGQDVVVSDDLSEFIFDKEKLGNLEFLSTSSIYEFWSEGGTDSFSEEDFLDDLDSFRRNISQIVDDAEVQEVLFKIYKNLTNFRKYNFANSKIEKYPEIGERVKENIKELVLLLKENQELILSHIPNKSSLKKYFPVTINDGLDSRLNTITRFCKIRNYTNKFAIEHLLDNQTLTAFIEQDGAFYRVIGINKPIEQNNSTDKNLYLPFDDNKILSNIALKFAREGILSNITIFDHHTNQKRILSEGHQIYVDSKELLKLLMNDFLKEGGSFEINEDVDLKELTNIFSRKVRDQFDGKNEEHQEISNPTPDKIAIEKITVSYEKEDNNLNINFLMKDETSKQMYSSIKSEYSQIMDNVFCSEPETKIELTELQYDYFDKKINDNLKREIKTKVKLDCDLRNKIFKLSPNKTGKKSIQIISKTYPKNS